MKLSIPSRNVLAAVLLAILIVMMSKNIFYLKIIIKNINP